MFKRYNFFLIPALAMCFLSCSKVQRTDRPATTAEKAQSVVDPKAAENRESAIRNDASFVTEISFEKNSANLTQSSKQRLHDLITQAKAAGEVEDIKVLSWSDGAYPADESSAPARAQRNLANERNKRIKEYLVGHDDGVDVDTFNMTERPNTLEKLLRTEDYRIKKSFEDVGIAANNPHNPSKSGKSVVMAIIE